MKLTTLFQARVSAVQQGAIAALTAATVLITLVGIMVGLNPSSGDDPWPALYAGVIIWGAVVLAMVRGFARSAHQARADYRTDHAHLFPDAPMYALESFLLDVADRNPRLSTRWDKPPTGPASG